MDKEHIFIGNTVRLHTLFDRMRQGTETVSLVFLGASVTLGYRIEPQHQFPNIVTKYFQDKYNNPNITCYNLSEPGVPSLHGLYLSYFEIEKLSPDIIFIDYSINDQKSSPYREAFESLLVRCLSLPSRPAVLPFFVSSMDGYTCAPQMAIACEHYQVPYVQVNTWLFQDIKEKKLRWIDYSYDDRHPGPFGHGYIARCLIRLFEIAESESVNSPDSLPSDCLFHDSLAHLSLLYKSREIPSEPAALPIQFEAECSVLFICYEVGTTPDYATACLTSDGREIHQFCSYRINEWDHLTCEAVYLSKETAPHQIQLTVQKGDEPKAFRLRCLGVG